MTDPLTEQVLSALAKVKNIPKESVTLDSTLQSLRMDSLDTITLLFELEDALGVKISDEAAHSVRTVQDIVDGIRRLQAEPQVSAAAAESKRSSSSSS